MEENNLLTFKAISNFINALHSVFGEKQRSLKLYNHLVQKTTIVHEEPIKKHIKAWYIFFKKNKNAILNKDYKDFSEKKVIYSDKVYVNLYDIFEDNPVNIIKVPQKEADLARLTLDKMLEVS